MLLFLSWKKNLISSSRYLLISAGFGLAEVPIWLLRTTLPLKNNPYFLKFTASQAPSSPFPRKYISFKRNKKMCLEKVEERNLEKLIHSYNDFEANISCTSSVIHIMSGTAEGIAVYLFPRRNIDIYFLVPLFLWRDSTKVYTLFEVPKVLAWFIFFSDIFGHNFC